MPFDQTAPGLDREAQEQQAPAPARRARYASPGFYELATFAKDQERCQVRGYNLDVADFLESELGSEEAGDAHSPDTVVYAGRRIIGVFLRYPDGGVRLLRLRDDRGELLDGEGGGR